jgi:hypothetical protein
LFPRRTLREPRVPEDTDDRKLCRSALTALEKARVEPIGLRSAMFARHRNARCMNDVSFDAVRGDPTRQPEAVGSVLERDGDPCDPVAFYEARGRRLEELRVEATDTEPDERRGENLKLRCGQAAACKLVGERAKTLPLPSRDECLPSFFAAREAAYGPSRLLHNSAQVRSWSNRTYHHGWRDGATAARQCGRL